MFDGNNSNALIVAGGSIGNLSVISNIGKTISILKELNYNISLVTYCGDNIDLDASKIYLVKNYKSNIFNFLVAQISILKHIIQLSNKFDIVFFIFGQDLLIFPIIFSKCLGKKVIIRSDGRPSTVTKKYFINSSKLKQYLFLFIEEINYRLADALLTECEYMISENKFNNYKNVHVGNLFIDVKKFVISKDLTDRPFDIGYIGRLHPEKGIFELISIIPNLILNKNETKIFIGGDGESRDQIKNDISNMQLSQSVSLGGWIPHEQLPTYLNNIKLLILPSFKEGLPNIILEAMACGTPVLATSVGGIPGVIQDGETGFIMENNSPECIMENVMRVFDCPHLEEIAKNGRSFVEVDYSFEETVEKWKHILQDIE